MSIVAVGWRSDGEEAIETAVLLCRDKLQRFRRHGLNFDFSSASPPVYVLISRERMDMERWRRQADNGANSSAVVGEDRVTSLPSGIDAHGL